MKNKAGIRPGDILVILLCLALIVLSFVFIKAHGGDKKSLVVIAMGKEYSYSMDQDGTYEVQGRLGVSVIEVKDGRVRFLESPCPTKSCVQHTAISAVGEWSACLPNEILVRIEGNESEEMDALSF
ncbi:MAG: NusG domain II-containing protein [Treponema sp.]|nr:NusG domain II-containing protein [Treponema sp.]